MDVICFIIAMGGKKLKQKKKQQKQENKDNDKGQKKFDSFKEEIYKRQSANSNRFDNAILTLSAASLGFSVALIKDVVPLNEAEYLCFLISSWIFFSLAIISTIISFYCSQKGLKAQLDKAEDYYIRKKPEARTRRNPFAKATAVFNNLSAALFILGVLVTVTFVTINITGGSMNEEKKSPKHEKAQTNDIKHITEIPVSEAEEIPYIPEIAPTPDTASQSQSDKEDQNVLESNKKGD